MHRKRTAVPLLFVALSLSLAVAALTASGADAAPPKCNGLLATLWEPNGVSVEQDGRPVFVGTEGDDVIVASAVGDRVSARGGDDIINAGVGADLVLAGAGNDELLGEVGDDQLFGHTGFDESEGNQGRDLCDGGRDSYVVRANGSCEQERGIELWEWEP